MKEILLTLYILLSIQLIACANNNQLSDIYPPRSEGEIVAHTYFTLCYVEEHEQASWVFYHLTEAQINGPTARKDSFKADPSVSTGSATLADYSGSGYDRGHLCPAGSMKLDATAMSESFYMSNMSPQLAGFNRGVWSRMETAVRNYVLEYGDSYVVTGPVFMDCMGAIGENRVTVPGYYYKAVYNPRRGIMHAFLVPHASSSADLSVFCVSVDMLEELIGVDLFADLDKGLQERLESVAEPF